MNVSRIGGVTLMLVASATQTGTSGQGQDGARNGNRSAAALPKDIYSDSRNRLPLPKREDMDDYGKQILDNLPPGQQLSASVHSVRLYSPVARPMEEAARYLNFETGLPERLIEIAILVTAREMECQFEWTQNEPRGRDAGDARHLEANVIDAIKYRKGLAGLTERDAAVIALGREMFHEKKVSPATFGRVLGFLGRKGTLDLVELMANYSAAASELAALDQQLKEGQKPLLPSGAK